MRIRTRALAILILTNLTNSAMPQEAAETWSCSERYSRESAVLVVAIINEGRSSGSIRVAGTTYTTAFRTQGFDRRWDWEESSESYAFVVAPNGDGAYFDFSFADNTGNAQPRQLYSCTDREPSARVERQLERQLEMQRALAAEEERRRAEEVALLDQYARLIEDRIERNWIRPASAGPGLRCEVNVTQIPSGDVIGVRVGRCNGDDSVIRSIEAAVLRASPLPQPPTPSLFSRDLIVNFEP
jgi:hypothetical protein